MVFDGLKFTTASVRQKWSRHFWTKKVEWGRGGGISKKKYTKQCFCPSWSSAWKCWNGLMSPLWRLGNYIWILLKLGRKTILGVGDGPLLGKAEEHMAHQHLLHGQSLRVLRQCRMEFCRVHSMFTGSWNLMLTQTGLEALAWDSESEFKPVKIPAGKEKQLWLGDREQSPGVSSEWMLLRFFQSRKVPTPWDWRFKVGR